MQHNEGSDVLLFSFIYIDLPALVLFCTFTLKVSYSGSPDQMFGNLPFSSLSVYKADCI